MAPPKFTTPPETLAHPAYPTAIWNLEPHREGVFAAAFARGGPVNIAWQIHGDGPIRVVLIAGLASTRTMWQRQLKRLGHDLGTRFSVLCFDNRGIGRSAKPLARYSTSQMALDTLELADHVGWTGSRALHLVGISMGGMIAQEVAFRSPERLASLTLVSTAAAVENTHAWHDLLTKRAAMLVPRPLEKSIVRTARKLFSDEWMAAPDAESLPSPGSTPRCGPAQSPDGEYLRFETNFQRFQALELAKRRDPAMWSTVGFLCQLVAAVLHRKSDVELRFTADRVGHERIAVVHGTLDEMFDVIQARKLIKALEPAEVHINEGMRHAPIYENFDWFNPWLEGWLEKTQALNQ